ncbi:hypothetical protein RB601_008430 [Gaeumannomyces tritici]
MQRRMQGGGRGGRGRGRGPTRGPGQDQQVQPPAPARAHHRGGAQGQEQKEELDDVSTELELADEDETVPYKVGDAFFHVSLPQAQEMLGMSGSRLEGAIEELEDSLGTIKEEMTQLKVELYARFGKSIQLET